MLRTFTLLLLFQLSGEVITRAFGIRVPGPVLGMALFFALLLWRNRVSHEVKTTVGNLLQHLSLLFVPAAVGIIQQLDSLSKDGSRLIIVITLSTAITMAVSALVLHLLMRNRQEIDKTS